MRLIIQKSMSTLKRKQKKKELKIEGIKCLICKLKFGIDGDYIGIITCPYCGSYVEG